MDSTLFEYTGGHPEPPKAFSNKTRTPRPVSAQSFKVSHLISPNYRDTPKVTFTQQTLNSNRSRPVSAAKPMNNKPQLSESGKNQQYTLMGDIRPEQEVRLAERVAAGDSMHLSDVENMIRNENKLNKEKLYGYIQHLQRKNEAMAEENSRIKSKNFNLEKENIKLMKYMERSGGTTIPTVESARGIQYAMMTELRPEEEARLVEKVAAGEPTQMPDIQKLMPKKVRMDKERLYEDTLHLKQEINGLKEENMRIKTRNFNLEKENIKLTKCLEKAGNVPVQPGKQNESALMVALKKQVKDLKEELKAREEELDQVERNLKFTKFQELELELRAYADENIRLKTKYEELMRARPVVRQDEHGNVEEQYMMQNGYVETLQKDHERLAAEVKFLEDNNYSLQVARELDLKNIQKLQNEISKLRKLIKEKELKPAQNYRPESASGAKGNAMKQEERLKLEEENNELKKFLEHREQIIHQRDRALEDMKQKFNDRMSNELKEKQNHVHEVNKLKDHIAELESKYRALINIHHPTEDNKRRSPEGRSNSKYDEDLPSDSRIERSMPFETKAKKVKRVMVEDVAHLGDELSLRLRVRRITLEETMKVFEKFGPKISLLEIKNILSHDPFGVKDEASALLLARYLVEPNDDEVLTFDINRIQDLSIIKSVFRKLVRSYTLLGEEELKIMNNEVSDIIHKYEQGLQTQFTLMPESKSGYLSSEQILKAFKMIDIAISPKNFEYLIMNLYEYTGNLKKLDYNKMFEIFETEEHKRLKRVFDMYQHQNDADSDRSDRKVVKFKDEEGLDLKRKQTSSPTKRSGVEYKHNLDEDEGEEEEGEGEGGENEEVEEEEEEETK